MSLNGAEKTNATARIDDVTEDWSGEDRAAQNDSVSTSPPATRPAVERQAREEPPLPTKPPFRAFVSNLAYALTEEELDTFFGGKTKSVKIKRNKEGRSKGQGFVDFNSVEELQEALEDTEMMLAGRPIKVAIARPRKKRVASRKKDTPQAASGQSTSGSSAAPPSQPSARAQGWRARMRSRRARQKQKKSRGEAGQDTTEGHENEDTAEPEVGEDL